MTPLEQRLRELCAYYEWSEPPNLAAADTLQGAADALKKGQLSTKAAELIVAVWQPFVGIEAQAGHPPMTVIADTEADFQRGIIEHMRETVARENNTAKRVQLVKLMEEQIALFVTRTEVADAAE